MEFRRVAKSVPVRPAMTLAAAALGLGALAACEAGPNPADWPDQLEYGVRDSAGVTIVESSRPAPDSRLGWRVGEEPRVRFGAAEGETAYQLYEVGDATRLDDGRIVVANGGSNELLVFDSAGGYLEAWAGQGEGPGEFQSLGTVHRWGPDSLIAGDAAAAGSSGRVAIFDLAGNHGRTGTLTGEIGGFMARMMAGATRAGGEDAQDPEMPEISEVGGGSTPHAMIDVLPGNAILTREPGGFMAGFSRWEHAYGLVGADWGESVSLGEYPGPETFADSYTNEGERMVYFLLLPHPFGKTTTTAVWGDLVVFGRNETYEIRAFAADGSLARIVRREHAVGTPTQEQQDARFRARFADLPEEERASRLEVAANVPLVETFPAYSAIMGDALGNLWVREFDLPGEERDSPLWTVFDREGKALGFVETPAGLTIYEIGADFILGKRTGELDVESVELWGLARS